jgi:hypothetical protein
VYNSTCFERQALIIRSPLTFLVRASSYIPISRPTDATCDRFLYSIYMCITLHVGIYKFNVSWSVRASLYISIRREYLQVFLCTRRRVVLPGFIARGQSWRNMEWTGRKEAFLSWNLPKLPNLTSAASPRVDISRTCKVGQKFGVSLPLLTFSPSAWPSRLLYGRGRKFRWELWITLYIGLSVG